MKTVFLFSVNYYTVSINTHRPEHLVVWNSCFVLTDVLTDLTYCKTQHTQ